MEQVLNRATRSFASDNNAGVHPEVLEAIARANQGHVVAYGDDPYTRSAIKKFEEHFGPDIDVFFTFNGTGANVLGLQALNRPYHAVLCSDYAHIYTDECGAPEKHTGCKLIPLPQQNGCPDATAVGVAGADRRHAAQRQGQREGNAVDRGGGVPDDRRRR